MTCANQRGAAALAPKGRTIDCTAEWIWADRGGSDCTACRIETGSPAVTHRQLPVSSIGHLAKGTNSESCTRSFTGTSLPLCLTASMSCANWLRILLCVVEAKDAALKLVGKLTARTLARSSAGRLVCGSGEHKVTRDGSKRSHTRGSEYAASSATGSIPGMRFRYGNGGMFISERHGTRASPILLTRARTA